ncbi:MAG: hypothetical protein WCI84_07420, partial [Bacteroidota bacterium]
IGTNVGGIPTAIGESGSIIDYGNVQDAVKAVMTGLAQNNNSSARERIATLFTKHKREQQITSHIDSLINAK